jgi:PAS domain S-box-containing protein
MNSGLMTTDRNGNIISYNKLALDISRKIGEKIEGCVITKFLKIKKSEFRKIRDLLLLNNIHVMEKTFFIRNGGLIQLTFNISILPNSKGEIIGYIFSFQDLTELHKLKDELKMKDKIAALGSMAAAIAHEIRNPLASISGSAQELTSGSNLPDNDKALMNIIVKEAKRLNKIITEYLNFSRHYPFTPRETDLIGAIQETILLAMKSPSYKENLHDIQYISNNEISKYIGDADALKQVFWNLILNSLQAMPDGGILRISLTENKHPHEIILSFIDEGSGIPEERKDEIFQPFKTFGGEGYGLGLSVVYRIVDEHGGRVIIKNNLPQGTRVELSLPFKDYDLSPYQKDSLR